MKLLFSFCVIATTISCTNTETHVLMDFIPGTFVRYTEHETGREWDTIEISRLSPAGNNYNIKRRWAYERKLNGVTLPVDYKQEEKAALYDEEKSVLTETTSGVVLSFVPEKKILYAGTTAYQKIK